jgi:hypothetical protein
MGQGLESGRAIRQADNCTIVSDAKVQAAALAVGKGYNFSSHAFRIFQLAFEFPVLAFALGQFGE